jgi:aryl-alcohol dehydrogenase-like predicted oxidoreductase
MWDYLQFQKTRGVIKNLGLSLKHELVKNRDNVQIKQASKFGISVVQTVFNPLNQQSLEYVIHSARTEGLKIIGRMPLSKGLIPKMSIEDLEQIISPDSEVKELITEYWNKCKFGKNSLPVAVKIGLTLNWCLKQVDAVVLAHSSIDQLVMNSRVIEAISFKD